MHRTWLSIPVALILLMASAQAATFPDTENSFYGAAIDELVRRGIVQGYTDGTFRPNALINRAEFLKILIESRHPNYAPKSFQCFADVASLSPTWYAGPVCAGKELGIVQGYSDNTFRPERAVNLVEALKMAFLSFGITPSPVAGEWYQKYLAAAVSRGILPHLMQSPDHLITRGEMASITHTLLVGGGPTTGTAVCGNGKLEEQEQCDDGNLKDSDGCSSICFIVSEPTFRSIVQIDQVPTGTASATAGGKNDVTLFKFTAVAGRQPATLTRVAFKASVGSLLYGQRYELLVDSNNDGTYELIQSSTKVQGGILSFENMLVGGVQLPVGVSLPFLIRADIAPSGSSVSLGLEFATTLPDYIEAQGTADGLALEGIETDGVCANNCFIRVTTSDNGTVINVDERGSLFISADSTPVRSHILLAGSTTPLLMRMRMRSVGEDVNLSFIAIDGVSDSVDSLRLHLLAPGDAGTSLPTPVANATRSQCPSVTATRICVKLPDRAVVIVPSQERVLAFSAVLLADTVGGESGETAALAVSAATGTATHAFEAQGLSSDQSLVQNDNDGALEGEIVVGRTTMGGNTAFTGTTHDTALASIGSIVNDGQASSSVIPSGNQTIGSFRISALTHTNSFGGMNSVEISSMRFHINAQNVKIDNTSVVLFNAADPSSTASCTANAATGNITVTCGSLTNIAASIDSGYFSVFRLAVNVTNTEVAQGNSSLQVSLPVLGQRGITNSVSWNDEESTFTWVDIPETSVSSTLYQR